MRNLNVLILIFASVIVFSGCAATYMPVNPPVLNYSSHSFEDGIEFSYKYDVMMETGNKKYARKADRKGVKLIAIKITNNSDTVINLSGNAAFYSGQDQLFPLEPIAIKGLIKQIAPVYLPYLLMSVFVLNVSNGIQTNTYPVGIALGVPITAGNIIAAALANKNMLTELYAYNVLYRDIQKGETVYGIIGIRDMEYCGISVKLIK